MWQKSGNPRWEAKSGVYVGSCLGLLFRYSAGLEATEAAADLAKSHHDPDIAGGAEINASSIYAQLGSFALAERKLAEAIADLAQTDRRDLFARAYLALSYLQIRLGETTAGFSSSDRCLKIAHDTKNAALEANAWDLRGTALLLTGQTLEADKSLAKAVEIYRATGKATIPSVTLEHLAELKWKQQQNEAALHYIDLAFANPDPVFNTSPQYYPLSVRAGILRDLGRTDDALATYRKAIHSANLWRRATLPGDATNIETVRQLTYTYQSFAELAAEQSLARRDDSLAAEALESLAQNRAASLREQLALDLEQARALPAEYLAKLGELQSVQARVTLGGDAASQSRLAELESEVGELETKIGQRTEKKIYSAENNFVRNSLRDIQTGLGSSEALLSFCLGERSSFLWAITGNGMHLYRLPAAGEIGAQATAVRNMLTRKQNYAVPARKLSDELFSQLDSSVKSRPDWLIVGDGPLLDRVPFAMLPTTYGGKTLTDSHTIRLLPSELLMLSRTTDKPQARFLGIADPLYNLADSRRPQPVLRNALDAKGWGTLGRLPGSQREVRAAAKYSGIAETDLLVGRDANIAAIAAALSARPSIVHFAVHVVSPPEHPEQAALALSLGNDNVPELLTREKIASLRAPGSLVVLSGCSSGQGKPAPSIGLIGLSRAWLLAGASAVIVSNWPTPDDSGPFFTVFYSLLGNTTSPGARSGSLAQRAASALQKAQLEMQRRGGYGSAPAFWAAYSLVSKE